MSVALRNSNPGQCHGYHNSAQFVSPHYILSLLIGYYDTVSPHYILSLLIGYYDTVSPHYILSLLIGYYGTVSPHDEPTKPFTCLSQILTSGTNSAKVLVNSQTPVKLLNSSTDKFEKKVIPSGQIIPISNNRRYAPLYLYTPL